MGSPGTADFLFPYPPYSIQEQMMRKLYQVLDEKKIGLFESPTGTGKTLSLLCGAIKWLRDHQDEPLMLEDEFSPKLSHDHLQDATCFTHEGTESTPLIPNWVRAHFDQTREIERIRIRKEYREQEEEFCKKLAKLRQKSVKHGLNLILSNADETRTAATLLKGSITKHVVHQAKRLKMHDLPLEGSNSGSSMVQSNSKFLLSNDHRFDDDDEIESDGHKSHHRQGLGLERVELLEKPRMPCRKIFFSSRTHSQLAQVVQECRLTQWGKDIRLVILGSRKTMCINPSVNLLPSMAQIKDKCLDLLAGKKTIKQREEQEDWEKSDVSKESKCPYYDQEALGRFADQILAKPQDIEELVNESKQLATCPYYSTRLAIESAELVVLPYHTLLHKPTRESLGIDLRGNVIILDEAHNLVDTMNAIYTIEIDVVQISQALAQLSHYLSHHQQRLTPDHIVDIEKLIFILKALLKFMSPISKAAAPPPSVEKDDLSPPLKSTINMENEESISIMTLNEFLFKSPLDNVNLFKLDRFLKETDIAKKVLGFCTSTEMDIKILKEKRKITIELDESEFERHRPALGSVAEFLLCLINRNEDGRILTRFNRKDFKKSSIKYILLNPEIHFQDILIESRAVILAGGTMQPFETFSMYLLPNPHLLASPKQSLDRIIKFECTHIIPESNMLTLVLSQGPTGKPFQFTYEDRQSNELMDELGITILNMSHVVPEGMILFFSSYQYEEQVMNHWKNTRILAKIAEKKLIFREPKGTMSVDELLHKYAKAIDDCIKNPNALGVTGAMLSCVVGGKLSEGINFKDGLGRCIVMVGLPYPNVKDPILSEKLAFIHRKIDMIKQVQGGCSIGPTESSQKKLVDNEFYDNICMKAVNQSVGRAIRHIHDYATILLVDQRYLRPSIRNKLPKWIRKSLVEKQTFGQTFKSIADFFKAKHEP